MSETLMALMKKGSSGGGGGSDFIGQNQYLLATGDNKGPSYIGNDVYNYNINDEIAGAFGTHDQLILVNVMGHTSADVTTGSRYDGVFGIANGAIYTLISATSQTASGTFTIDITNYDYIFVISSSYSGRKVVITN